MTKNKNQIVTFLKTVRAKAEGGARAELHKMAILGYCRSVLGIQVTFGEEDPTLPEITLEEFKLWINEDTFQRGDVVVDTESGGIGIVDFEYYQKVSFAFFWDKKEDLYEGSILAARTACRNANHEEIIDLQRFLNRKKLGWNKRRNVLFTQDYTPKENHQVRLSILGKKMGLGVFKEIDDEGRIIMYCVKMEGEKARYSLHEVIGPAEDYQINQISTYEREILTEELKKSGVVWNGHLKRIDRVCTRVDKGELYYYLNDLFEVIPKSDEYQSRDTKRWRAGNYFTQKEEAEAIREKLISRKTRMQS